MTTIRDIAKKLNVSAATISRVISQDPTFKVSWDTKEKILAEIEKLNYHPRKYQKSKKINIGILMSLTYTYGDSFFYDILTGIQEYCSKHNIIISLIANYEQFHENYSLIEDQLSKLDGLIITDLPRQKEDFLSKLKCKVVFVDCFFPGYANVGYDKVYANRIILNHLISCNYKKIAYIGGPSNEQFYSSTRMMVYKTILEENGIPFNPEYIYNCDWNSKICSEQVKDLIQKHPDIEAIFAGSDSLATAIISTLQELKLKCPTDIGVTGFNDNQISQNYNPPITTVELPSKEMGRESARILLRQIIKNKIYDYQVLLPVKLKIRDSTLIKKMPE